VKSKEFGASLGNILQATTLLLSHCTVEHRRPQVHMTFVDAVLCCYSTRIKSIKNVMRCGDSRSAKA